VLFGQQSPDNGGETLSPSSSSHSAAQANKRAELTNEDIIKLSQVGLDPDVIITKIKTAPKVVFSLETDDLIALKKAGVNQEVITAMMNRAANPMATGNGNSSSGSSRAAMTAQLLGYQTGTVGEDIPVRLVSKKTSQALSSIRGHLGTTYAVVTVLSYMDYPNLHAGVRTKDRRPYLLIQSAKSLEGRFYLVRCKVNEDDHNRSVKLGRSHLWSTKGMGIPDDDWTIPFSIKQVQRGLWRIDPEKDLKPGEYGLWGPMQELYDFGVDK
jgi:hypothetical protein